MTSMNIVRTWPLLSVSIAMLIGSAIGSGVASVRLVHVLAAAGLLALVGIGMVLTHRRRLLVVPIAGLLVMAAAGYVVIRTMQLPAIESQAELVDHQATVVSAPERQFNEFRAYMDLQLDEQSFRVRATWRGDELEYGDVVEISGTVEPPQIKPAFNEQGFLRAHHAHGTLSIDRFERTDDRAGNHLLQNLHDTRSWLLTRLTYAIDRPERAVIGGVLLGDRSEFSAGLEDAFRTTGTTHILVVSGSNVVIIAGALQFLLASASRRWRVALISAVLLAFIVISGADASIIRATIFYEFFLLANLTGRRIHALTLAAFVALLMVLLNPWILLYDIAFQLSFAAILGLMIYGGWLYTLLPAWLIPQFLAPTLAAQLLTLPILIFHFGQVSLIAPLANLLVVPMVPAVMAGGALAIALPWLGAVTWAATGATSILVWIVEQLAAVPYASIALPSRHLLWTGLALIVAGSVYWFKQRQQPVIDAEEAAVGYE